MRIQQSPAVFVPCPGPTMRFVCVPIAILRWMGQLEKDRMGEERGQGWSANERWLKAVILPACTSPPSSQRPMKDRTAQLLIPPCPPITTQKSTQGQSNVLHMDTKLNKRNQQKRGYLQTPAPPEKNYFGVCQKVISKRVIFWTQEKEGGYRKSGVVH
ncbi:uncharacterized protein CC84DRAFT_1180773 [Paraphaeosphaeria sporulosa]|uniref:Uncharacterized protein n=1 Tax=Paraphaeosphaeria sporulosa TaxID=1460663 RepID=A0A177BZC2_9PLEO|nr:uncharacterized protein CC84DRAFT_1180773 [Paraphaeosphaeria sporulosa]OAF99931.1 hypothetical protein CC84DRAFT_1180773 [Paraphaeosphaeria sporulosa]